MPHGTVIELAFFAFYKQRRRNIMFNQNLPSLWQKGDRVYVPGVGQGTVVEPGRTLTKVRIGDMVPCLIPTRALQRPLPPRKQFLPNKPRRAIFDFSLIHGGLW